MDSVTVGLDIGSSAVRAAEIEMGRDGRRVLRRYAQIGLPAGHVVDGEIHNIPGVAGALRRLWNEASFSTKKVVLGVSGPRVFIRQADVTAMRPEDLRSSLKFEAQDLVPIPMEDAVIDFSLLDGPQPAEGDGGETQRILLVAAHRDLLRTYLATMKEAALEAVVMDAAPLALMRAVPAVAGDGRTAEVIVSVGAELTTVAVRQDGLPRFIRSLTVGGSKLTETIAHNLHIEMATAERLKRGAVDTESPYLTQARKVVTPEMKDLAEEIRATIDFFMAQSGHVEVERLLVTGGGSLTEKLPHAIAGDLPAQVLAIDALAPLDTSRTGYSPDQLRAISAGATTAVGLALWPTEAPFIRLSLLPEEVREARRTRRIVTGAGVGLVAVIGALGVGSAVQVLAVHSAKHKAAVEQSQAASLNVQVSQLEKVTAVHGQVGARAGLAAQMLQGDVNWVQFVGRLSAAMPPNTQLTSLSLSRQKSAAAASASAGLGTVSMSIKGTGGLPTASAWLVDLARDPDLTNLTIGGMTVDHNGGTVTFTSTANLTSSADSHRSQEFSK